MKILFLIWLIFSQSFILNSQDKKEENQNPYKKLVIAAWRLSSRISPNPIKLNYVFDNSFFKSLTEEKTIEVLKKIHSENGEVVNVTSVTYHSNVWGDFFFHTDKDYIIPVTITINDSGKIVGVFFRPSFKKTAFLEDITKKFEALSCEKKGLLIKKLGSIEDNVYALNEKEIFPMGSAFKLYILAYMVENDVKWDKVVKIKESDYSLPTGKMHLYPKGAPITLFSLAEAMISQSDNTATDILIENLGRENIENFMKEHNSKPELNIPFLKTAEMFKIKSSTQIAENYIKADTKEKRKILEKIKETRPDIKKLLNISSPYKPYNIEWFASPSDICSLMDYFKTKNNVYSNAILSINPGLDTKTGEYAFAGYKGGSESGVLSMNWLLKTKNQTYYCVSSFASDEKQNIDEKTYFSVMQEILNVLSTK